MSEALTPPVEGASPLGGQSTPAAEGAATLEGGAGNDSIATGGDSTTSGASGNDSITSAEGNDSVTATEYTDFTLPDTIQVDDAVMGEFKEFAKTNGLSQEAAQAALDLYVKQITTQGETFAAAQTAAWNTTIDSWKTQLAAIPDFAGENGPKAQAVIGRALDTYGSQETRDAFDLTGAGWHPAILSFVHNMAKALDEGNLIPGGKPAPKGPQSLGQVLYGDEKET